VNKRVFLFLYVAALISSAACARVDAQAAKSSSNTSIAADAPIEFSPSEWKFGVIDKDEIVRLEVVATNHGVRSLELSMVPTCDCLKVEPSSRRLEAGASGKFSLSFDPKNDEGKTNRFFLVKTRALSEAASPGLKPQYFILGGIVRPGARGTDTGAVVSGKVSTGATGAGGAGGAKLIYYYTPGCRSCERFLSVELPELEARSGVSLEVVRRDLLSDTAYEELAAFASSVGATINSVPALRFGKTLLQGDEEIKDKLPGLLAASRGGTVAVGGTALDAPASAKLAGEAANASGPAGIELAVLPVLAAGLVDGINPCAFTTLVFLLASLALAGRSRREILAIGAFFSAGVFFAYLGAGFGLFAALRAAQAVALVSAILRWVLVAVLAVFAVLSVYDYTRIRAGKPSDMLLQLPDSLKLKIHASIRDRRRASALALSSFVLGLLVSIFEFACTGQVYLPTLAYLARAKGRGDALALLVAYNLCFIAPLLVVFGASYLGVSSKRIADLFQRRMGAVKLLLAAVFAALAVLTLIA
jgi:cytochrome c biogenesis protein CcdA